MADILVLYYSRNGATEALAREVCKGVDSVDGMSARLRTVPQVSAVSEAIENVVPESGPPFATNADLEECAGLIMGSPEQFRQHGRIAEALSGWHGRRLAPGGRSWQAGGVFASTGSLHGGQETTLISMSIPLLHHGMIVVGLPYSEEALSSTQIWRNAVRPDACQLESQSRFAVRRREGTRACARQAGCRHRKTPG